MKKTIEIEPFAYGYLKAKGVDKETRIARAIRCYAENVDIKINPKERFVGNTCRETKMGIRFCSNSGFLYDAGGAKQVTKDNPLLALPLSFLRHRCFPHIGEFIKYWHEDGKTHKLALYKNLWGAGSGHGNPDYKLLLDLGTNGLREKIASFRLKNAGKDAFYDALVMTLDSFDILARRYREKAEKMLGEAKNEEDKSALKRIVDALENIPQNKPRNFFEACQAFWLAFSFLEIDSPGLFDYALGEYYKNDVSGDRYDSLGKLWELFHKTRSWNLCVGGSDENGNDLCNELTYDVLKVAAEKKYNTPNITMRFHKNSPEKAWDKAIETLSTGIGMPAIYNDECVCVALERLGVTPKDSRLYCMNGCNQIDIFGKSHMGLEDGEICVAKALEYTLFHGRCRFLNRKLGLDLGDPSSFKTFDDFLAAFYKEIDYMLEKVTSVSNAAQKIHAEYSPNPWRSCLIEGCVEKGVDYKRGGPIYGHGQILTEALPDTVDSLAAIKHFVYDEKKYTLVQLVAALKRNFVGCQKLYKDFSGYLKFGNDIPEVDKIYKEVTEYIYASLQTFSTFRGGKFGGGCSTYNRAAEYGRKLGALPNGKKKGETLLADSIGAVPGCDKKGPTALLNSVLSADQTLATSGNVLQMKFDKKQFGTETGREAFKALAKTYFSQGGQTLQINVVSKEELLDAKAHPERHGDLIVRVGGFSEYFTRLEPALQDNIIQRSENGLL